MAARESRFEFLPPLSIDFPRRIKAENEMTDIEVSIWAAILTMGWMLTIWVIGCRNIDELEDRAY